jgi:hypothetical protein
MDLQDVKARALIGVRELDFAINTPGPQQRRVEDVNPVGGHEHLQK